MAKPSCSYEPDNSIPIQHANTRLASDEDMLEGNMGSDNVGDNLDDGSEFEEEPFMDPYLRD